MRHRLAWGAAACACALVLCGAVSVVPAADSAAPSTARPTRAASDKTADATATPHVTRVTLGVRHRVFPEFGQRVTTRMQERFRIGDTDYTGQLVQFMPHFDYDIKRRRARNLSNELKNPGFRVIVREKGVPKDTAWVFLNSPPHFARTSMLAFQVLKIELEGRPPLVADTTATGAGAR